MRAADTRAADVRAADVREAVVRTAREVYQRGRQMSVTEGAREGVRERATRRSSRMGFSSSSSSPVHNSAINWIFLPNSLQLAFHRT